MQPEKQSAVDVKHAWRVEQIEKLGIPKITLAALTNSHPSQITEWIADPSSMSAKRRTAIDLTVDKIVAVVTKSAELSLGITFNLRDVSTMKNVLAFMDAEAKRWANTETSESFENIVQNLGDMQLEFAIRHLIILCASKNVPCVVNLETSTGAKVVGFATDENIKAVFDAWQKSRMAPALLDNPQPQAAAAHAN
ncbi:MAG: hypothetical protein LAN36_11585 [Acidobacteriia bacterium]|nr:hypothetical protein [Terriglobia bacterium]